MNQKTPRWIVVYLAVTGVMALLFSVMGYLKPDVQFGTWGALGATGALSLGGPLGLYLSRNIATAVVSGFAVMNRTAGVVGAALLLRTVTDLLDTVHALASGSGAAAASFAAVMAAIDLAALVVLRRASMAAV